MLIKDLKAELDDLVKNIEFIAYQSFMYNERRFIIEYMHIPNKYNIHIEIRGKFRLNRSLRRNSNGRLSSTQSWPTKFINKESEFRSRDIKIWIKYVRFIHNYMLGKKLLTC